MGWNCLATSCWLLRLTRVTLPPWVMLVTNFPPVRWDLLRRTGLGTLVLTDDDPTLLRDLLTPPILTTLTPPSTASLSCCLFVVLLRSPSALSDDVPELPVPLCTLCTPCTPCTLCCSSFRVLGGNTGGGVRLTVFSDEVLDSCFRCLMLGLLFREPS